MVNSGSLESDADRNEKGEFTGAGRLAAAESPHSTAADLGTTTTTVATVLNGGEADFDVLSPQAIEPTASRTEYKCNMAFAAARRPNGVLKCDNAAGESKKVMSICCSVPLDKVKDVLKLCGKKVTNIVESTGTDDGTSEESPTREMCLYCDRNLTNSSLKQRHINRYHSLKSSRRLSTRRRNLVLQSVTSCMYCDKLSRLDCNLEQLFRHLVTEHADKYFGCLTCEKRFPSGQALAHHALEMHPRSHNPLSDLSSSLTSSSSSSSLSSATLKPPLLPPPAKKTTPSAFAKTKRKIKSLPTSLVSQDAEGVKNHHAAKNNTRVIASKHHAFRMTRQRTKLLENSKNAKRKLKSSFQQTSHQQQQHNDNSVTFSSSSSSSSSFSSASSSRQDDNHHHHHHHQPHRIQTLYPVDFTFKYKKITDHSIDNLKIASATFDDVFDKAFFNRVKCNIQDNLANFIDGKLFKSVESENRILSFQTKNEHASDPASQSGCSSSSSSTTGIYQPHNNHHFGQQHVSNCGSKISSNAATPVALLLSETQFGDDVLESQIEYGSKPSSSTTKKKLSGSCSPLVHYKYFTRRKYQAVLLKNRQQRDLSKLDMWTQLAVKERQQKLALKNNECDVLEYTRSDEYRFKMRARELDSILDKRGPVEDLKEEALRSAVLEKLGTTSSSSSATSTCGDPQSLLDVNVILDDLLNKLVLPDVIEISSDPSTRSNSPEPDPESEPIDEKPLISEGECYVPALVNLRRVSRERSRRGEDYDLKGGRLELTGEWARSRIYLCASCGRKFPSAKLMVEHKNLFHEQVWCQHYEFVGNQGELYRHLSIPGLGKVGELEKGEAPVWRRSEARTCTKCERRFNCLGDLHRHVLECGGDWSWKARKKYKYRQYGSKTRKRRRVRLNLLHALREKKLAQQAAGIEKKKAVKKLDGPRPKPSDADTIQRMLANLPAKRITRKIISLKDGIQRKRNNNKNAIPNVQSSPKKTKQKEKEEVKKQEEPKKAEIEKKKKKEKSAPKNLKMPKLVRVKTDVKKDAAKENKNSMRRQSLRNINRVLANKILPASSVKGEKNEKGKNLVAKKKTTKKLLQQQELVQDSHQTFESNESSSTFEEFEEPPVLSPIEPITVIPSNSSKPGRPNRSVKVNKTDKVKTSKKEAKKAKKDVPAKTTGPPKLTANKKGVKKATPPPPKKEKKKAAPAKKSKKLEKAPQLANELVQIDGSSHDADLLPVVLPELSTSEPEVCGNETSQKELEGDEVPTTEATTNTTSEESLPQETTTTADTATIQNVQEDRPADDPPEEEESHPPPEEEEVDVKPCLPILWQVRSSQPVVKRTVVKKKGLNDCIAMLTNKLQAQFHQDDSVLNLSCHNVFSRRFSNETAETSKTAPIDLRCNQTVEASQIPQPEEPPEEEVFVNSVEPPRTTSPQTTVPEEMPSPAIETVLETETHQITSQGPTPTPAESETPELLKLLNAQPAEKQFQLQLVEQTKLFDPQLNAAETSQIDVRSKSPQVSAEILPSVVVCKIEPPDVPEVAEPTSEPDVPVACEPTIAIKQELLEPLPEPEIPPPPAEIVVKTCEPISALETAAEEQQETFETSASQLIKLLDTSPPSPPDLSVTYDMSVVCKIEPPDEEEEIMDETPALLACVYPPTLTEMSESEFFDIGPYTQPEEEDSVAKELENLLASTQQLEGLNQVVSELNDDLNHTQVSSNLDTSGESFPSDLNETGEEDAAQIAKRKILTRPRKKNGQFKRKEDIVPETENEINEETLPEVPTKRKGGVASRKKNKIQDTNDTENEQELPETPSDIVEKTPTKRKSDGISRKKTKKTQNIIEGEIEDSVLQASAEPELPKVPSVEKVVEPAKKVSGTPRKKKDLQETDKHAAENDLPKTASEKITVQFSKRKSVGTSRKKRNSQDKNYTENDHPETQTPEISSENIETNETVTVSTTKKKNVGAPRKKNEQLKKVQDTDNTVAAEEDFPQLLAELSELVEKAAVPLTKRKSSVTNKKSTKNNAIVEEQPLQEQPPEVVEKNTTKQKKKKKESLKKTKDTPVENEDNLPPEIPSAKEAVVVLNKNRSVPNIEDVDQFNAPGSTEELPEIPSEVLESVKPISVQTKKQKTKANKQKTDKLKKVQKENCAENESSVLQSSEVELLEILSKANEETLQSIKEKDFDKKNETVEDESPEEITPEVTDKVIVQTAKRKNVGSFRKKKQVGKTIHEPNDSENDVSYTAKELNEVQLETSEIVDVVQSTKRKSIGTSRKKNEKLKKSQESDSELNDSENNVSYTAKELNEVQFETSEIVDVVVQSTKRNSIGTSRKKNEKLKKSQESDSELNDSENNVSYTAKELNEVQFETSEIVDVVVQSTKRKSIGTSRKKNEKLKKAQESDGAKNDLTQPVEESLPEILQETVIKAAQPTKKKGKKNEQFKQPQEQNDIENNATANELPEISVFEKIFEQETVSIAAEKEPEVLLEQLESCEKNTVQPTKRKSLSRKRNESLEKSLDTSEGGNIEQPVEEQLPEVPTKRSRKKTEQLSNKIVSLSDITTEIVEQTTPPKKSQRKSLTTSHKKNKPEDNETVVSSFENDLPAEIQLKKNGHLKQAKKKLNRAKKPIEVCADKDVDSEDDLPLAEIAKKIVSKPPPPVEEMDEVLELQELLKCTEPLQKDIDDVEKAVQSAMPIETFVESPEQISTVTINLSDLIVATLNKDSFNSSSDGLTKEVVEKQDTKKVKKNKSDRKKKNNVKRNGVPVLSDFNLNGADKENYVEQTNEAVIETAQIDKIGAENDENVENVQDNSTVEKENIHVEQIENSFALNFDDVLEEFSERPRRSVRCEEKENKKRRKEKTDVTDRPVRRTKRDETDKNTEFTESSLNSTENLYDFGRSTKRTKNAESENEEISLFSNSNIEKICEILSGNNERDEGAKEAATKLVENEVEKLTLHLNTSQKKETIRKVTTKKSCKKAKADDDSKCMVSNTNLVEAADKIYDFVSDEEDDSFTFKFTERFLHATKPNKELEDGEEDLSLDNLDVPDDCMSIDEENIQLDKLDDVLDEAVTKVEEPIVFEQEEEKFEKQEHLPIEPMDVPETSQIEVFDKCDPLESAEVETPQESMSRISKTKPKPRGGTKKKKSKSKRRASDIPVVCDICNRVFSHNESFTKHKRTLMHIAKLSELEALQNQSIIPPILDEQETLIEVTKLENYQENIITEEETPCPETVLIKEQDSPEIKNLLSVPETQRQLVDFISDVLDNDDEKIESKEIEPETTAIIPEQIVRCKSLGERKSFESDKLDVFTPIDSPTLAYENHSSYISSSKLPPGPPTATAADIIVEKQISLLENMIEDNRINFASSNLRVVEDDDEFSDQSNFSGVSSKQEDTVCTFEAPNAMPRDFKVATSAQYEEISEDSAASGQFRFEDRTRIKNSSNTAVSAAAAAAAAAVAAARKVLNRDEELFLECCSLLKSSSDAELSKKQVKSTQFLSNFGLKPLDELEWLEQKTIPKRRAFEGGSYSSATNDDYDAYSNSNMSDALKETSHQPTPPPPPPPPPLPPPQTFTSPVRPAEMFEDISNGSNSSSTLRDDFCDFYSAATTTSSTGSEEASNNFLDRFKVYDEESAEKDVDTKDHEQLENNEKNESGDVEDANSTAVSIEEESNVSSQKSNLVAPSSKLTQSFITSYTVSHTQTSYSSAREDNKKLMTKGAMKVFEGLKVSIPKEGLDMQVVLNCSPASKQQTISTAAAAAEKLQTKKKSSNKKKTNSLKKAIKNAAASFKKSVGNKLGLKVTKKKFGGDVKQKIVAETKDVYDFEETQDNVDAFSSVKSSELPPLYGYQKFKSDKRLTVETPCVSDLVTSKQNDSKTKKKINQATAKQSITKKKCMIMGRIFKNVAKPKIIDELSGMDQEEFVENYVLDCQKIGTVVENKCKTMSTEEIDAIFDRLLKGDEETEPKQQQQQQIELQVVATIEPHVDNNKSRPKTKQKKRPRTADSSDSSDEEYSIAKSSKRASNRKVGESDCVINLEQELRECIGVASRKSQRKCTSGKQNVLVEYWSSDESSMESSTVEKDVEREAQLSDSSPTRLPIETAPPESPLATITKDVQFDKKRKRKTERTPRCNKLTKCLASRKLSEETSSLTEMPQEHQPTMTTVITTNTQESSCVPTIASGRQKRNPVDTLYYWSSSSEDELQNVVEVKPVRDDEDEDDYKDDERPLQHGWIVGDSPKKLVTLLAHAKGKKLVVDATEAVKRNKRRDF